MRSTLAATLTCVALLLGCSSAPSTSPGSDRPVPNVLKDSSATTQPSLSERMESLLEELEQSLRRARR